MGTVINIFDRQVNASANALCYALGFTNDETSPLTRFTLYTIYNRAYNGPHECRNAAEIREDFTGFRQDLKQSLTKHKKTIAEFIGRNGAYPDAMIALALGHDVLATLTEHEISKLNPQQTTLVKTSKLAYHLVNSRAYIDQSDIDDLQPLESFTVLVRIRDHFQTTLNSFKAYKSRNNAYTLAALQKNISILGKFTSLDLGPTPLARRISERLSDIDTIGRQFNQGLQTRATHHQLHP